MRSSLEIWVHMIDVVTLLGARPLEREAVVAVLMTTSQAQGELSSLYDSLSLQDEQLRLPHLLNTTGSACVIAIAASALSASG